VRVDALDHVNIITADLEGTVRFYTELLELEPRDGPPPLTHENARWMYDESGRAILHINTLECPRAYDREVGAGPTGALHHVALRCSGYEEVRARLSRRGIDHQVNDVGTVALRQIFVLDPNQVLLELNFFGE
jgi:catechol 2,3-dioxygenase-like lactoylglutathione lyase family enzyme